MEYFNSGNVIVTDSRFAVEGQNYSIDDIKVSFIEENSNHTTNWKKFLKIWIGSIIFAALVLAAVILFVKDDPVITSTVGELAKTAAGLVAIFAVASWIVLLSFKPKTYTNKGEYILFLSTDNGKIEALSSQDHSWLSQIQDALNAAITKSRI